MDNSMLVGNYLLEVLNDPDNGLVEILGENKIFPLVAKEDTTYPFVIYTRDSLSVQYTKLVGHDNTINISYRVYSDNYDDTVIITNKIRSILERKSITIDNEIKINDLRIIGLQENYSENGFCQILTFTTQVE